MLMHTDGARRGDMQDTYMTFTAVARGIPEPEPVAAALRKLIHRADQIDWTAPAADARRRLGIGGSPAATAFDAAHAQLAERRAELDLHALPLFALQVLAAPTTGGNGPRGIKIDCVGGEYGQALDVTAHIIHGLLRAGVADGPAGFEYGGGSYGGACYVTRDAIAYHDPAEWLAEQRAEHEPEPPESIGAAP